MAFVVTAVWLTLVGHLPPVVLFATRLPSIVWDPKDLRFAKSFCGQEEGFATVYAPIETYLFFTCPHKDLMVAARDFHHDPFLGNDYFLNVHLVDEAGFKNCDIGPKSKLVLRCNDRPSFDTNPLSSAGMPLTQICNSVVCVNFTENNTYYFISTSNGSSTSLQSTSGGYCKTHNLRLAVKVCPKGECSDCPFLCCAPPPTTTPLPTTEGTTTTTTPATTTPATTTPATTTPVTTTTTTATTVTTTASTGKTTVRSVVNGLGSAPEPPNTVLSKYQPNDIVDKQPYFSNAVRNPEPVYSRQSSKGLLEYGVTDSAMWKNLFLVTSAFVVLLAAAVIVVAIKWRRSQSVRTERRFTFNRDRNDSVSTPFFVETPRSSGSGCAYV